MGDSKYSFSARSARAQDFDYASASIDDLFEQNKKKMIHESMNPRGVILRESRDSKANPNSVPIILALDETGSMGQIPLWLVREGLPTIMSKIIENGTHDPALMFLAIGDAKCDQHPLQVGQFESGDAELDQWLTRSYLEKNGGGNGGESYLLAWYFGAYHTVTDAWEKRKQKGFLFTTGDEPCHKVLNKDHINALMGTSYEKDFTDAELLEKAKETWNVYHFHIMQGSDGRYSLHYWQELLGKNCIIVDDYTKLPNLIASTIYENQKQLTKEETSVAPMKTADEEML